jgi:heme/copper-type cytochrome/quinol oxidase subunit 2
MRKISTVLYFFISSVVLVLLLWIGNDFLSSFYINDIRISENWYDIAIGHIIFSIIYLVVVFLIYFLFLKNRKINGNMFNFIKNLQINNLLKISIIIFLIFLSFILYRAVQNNRYMKVDKYIYDKWTEEKENTYDWR